MSYERMRDGYGDSFLLRSGSDAVDGFSPGAEVPWMRGIASDYISDALAGHSFRNALPSVSLASTLNVVAPLGT
jgi:hypothetical protein